MLFFNLDDIPLPRERSIDSDSDHKENLLMSSPSPYNNEPPPPYKPNAIPFDADKQKQLQTFVF